MIVKFLDKLGNMVKSITSIAYLPVDTEPVEDSNHLLTSGAVAGSIAQQSSNLAPEFSEDAYYEPGTLVMHDGKMYYNYKFLPAGHWNEQYWVETSIGDFLYRMKDPTAQEVLTIETALPRNTRITTLSCTFAFNPVTAEFVCNCSFTLSGIQTLSKNNTDIIHDYDDNYGLIAELVVNPNQYTLGTLGNATGSILAVTNTNKFPVPCNFIAHDTNTIGIIAAKVPFAELGSGVYVCTTSVIKPS